MCIHCYTAIYNKRRKFVYLLRESTHGQSVNCFKFLKVVSVGKCVSISICFEKSEVNRNGVTKKVLWSFLRKKTSNYGQFNGFDNTFTTFFMAGLFGVRANAILMHFNWHLLWLCAKDQHGIGIFNGRTQYDDIPDRIIIGRQVRLVYDDVLLTENRPNI